MYYSWLLLAAVFVTWVPRRLILIPPTLTPVPPSDKRTPYLPFEILDFAVNAGIYIINCNKQASRLRILLRPPSLLCDITQIYAYVSEKEWAH